MSKQESVMNSYYIKTFGCQMNVHDSERMAGILNSMGYHQAADETEASIILFNTCSIREKAEQKLFSDLGRTIRLKNRNPDVIIGVCGCIAQRLAEELFAKIREVDIVLGPRAVPRLGELIKEHLVTGEKQICTEMPKSFDEQRAYARNSSVVGYLTIMEGCNKYCSYCIVPFTRGHEVSKPVDMVLAEVRDMVAEGIQEVQLLGQNVNAYNDKESGTTFSGLLERVSEIPGVARIRFVTSHPNHLTEDIVKVMADRDSICNAIHLPPQSGSTSILKAMRRRYSREEFMQTIDLLRSYMPEIAISGDIIVGFPGETEEDFEQTMSMLAEVEFASLFSFVFSPRPGTKAADMKDDVPYAVKLARLQRLQEFQGAVQLSHHRRLAGQTLDVLFDGRSAKVEGQLTGRTEGNHVVNAIAPEGCVGRIMPVQIVSAGPHSLIGELAPSLTKAIV